MIIKNTVIRLSLILMLSGCTQKVLKPNEGKTSVKESKLHHIVLFNFKDDAPIDVIESSLYELFGSIKGVNDLSFNRNVSSRNLDKGYKHSFYMIFKSEFDRDSVFYPHPNYKKMGGVIGQHIKEYLIYDYWIPEKN
jgi:Stress responsive A/B Barrel Domain